MSTPEPDPEGRDARAEDDAWRDIVAHYGDRPDLTDLPELRDPGAGAPAAAAAEPPGGWFAVTEPHEERYVPPPAPAVPLPRGPRALAWLGVFGPPTLLLVCIVLGRSLPGWLAFLLFVAFVGGFGYLVATMRKRDDSDPWDDGAVV